VTEPSSTAPPEPKLFATLRQDARDLRSNWPREGIRTRAKRTFGELEEFYLSTGRRQRLANMRRARRWLYLTWWLIKSLILKLTPVRRVLLVVALASMMTRVGASHDGERVVIDIPVLGVLLVLFVLMLELKDKLLARNELEAGRAVQLALVPAWAPSLPGWDVYLTTRPANDVGGDLVDTVPLGDDRSALILADVAGKGLPAALLMAKLQATVRALAPDASSVDGLGAQINRILHRDGLPSSFSTMVYLDVSGRTGTVRVLNAGHMPPLVLRGSKLEELPRGGMALGLLAQAEYTSHEVSLAPGDTLVAYTDGVTEAMNADGEFFGDERLLTLLSSLSGFGARAIADQIVTTVDGFVAGAPAHDDLSLIVLRRTA
jgi:hypothetical protein